MTHAPKASVVIPTRARPDKLARCVHALAAQSLPEGTFELLIGADGPCPMSEAAATDVWTHAGLSKSLIQVVHGPQRGQAAVRADLLRLARGELIIFLNDDMQPAPKLVAEHLHAHDFWSTRQSSPQIVLGDSPWLLHQPDRLFDRLIRDTSMVFFYDRMRGVEDATRRDWGFRHAWMLNLSAPAWAIREAGGVRSFPEAYGYEDDDLAWRMTRHLGSAVRYWPPAIAHHDHRYEPDSYLTRELGLGRAAAGFAAVAPEPARAMFGRDLADPAEAAYTAAYLERERSGAERAAALLRRTADLPASALPDPVSRAGSASLEAHYLAHLPAKRYWWRLGLAQALGLPVPAVAHPAATPTASAGPVSATGGPQTATTGPRGPGCPMLVA